ncbi:OadG family protein [Pyrococcus abyssi]|uniref:MmdD-like methylmalonyl coA decarboxylase,delta chain, putative n=1 Tax=Pyrococcus abyssi (strain GE5 / Orsay) TaxID=272844 RepID=Q9V0A5_PYRAB|nr:OadG family protein [Pyrococcus abyssi]CAB49800.1 mmdD-like methylmalonyl coA decarboxylase,delta chain, putative [Pyrococcus abyssi GE5]CCE70293.1 TPA: hypothetical protein PAB1770 [Pyrococcus abyssi GE5]
MGAILEGFYLTILGVAIVFLVLSILAVVMYGIGEFERRSKREVETKEVKEEREEEEKVETLEKEEDERVAVITAAILAYLSQRVPKEVPIKVKPSQNWWLSSLTREIDEIENFNYRW